HRGTRQGLPARGGKGGAGVADSGGGARLPGACTGREGLRHHRSQRAPRARQPRAAADCGAFRGPAVSADSAGDVMKLPVLDGAYVRHLLLEMLDIPSPTGFTDEIVHYTGRRLEELGIPFEVTRRGAIRANITGKQERPDRAV